MENTDKENVAKIHPSPQAKPGYFAQLHTIQHIPEDLGMTKVSLLEQEWRSGLGLARHACATTI